MCKNPCVFVCIFTYTSTFMHVHVSRCTYMRTCVSKCQRVLMCMHQGVCMCVRADMLINTHTYMFFMYVFACIKVYVCASACIFIKV